MSIEPEECPHGMGDPAWCTLCNGRDKREKAQANEIKYWFEAGFDSKCWGCGTPILTGERLARTQDDRYLCEMCAPA